MVLDAHARAFALFKGTCGRGIYDSMKTAVENDLRRQRAPLQSPLHADVQPLPCRPSRLHADIRRGEGRGREPGWACLHATAAVQNPRRVERMSAGQVYHLHQGTPASGAGRANSLGGVEAKRPKLVPCAGGFDGFHAVPALVSKTCLVRYDNNNKYSVTASAVGRPV